MPLHAAARVGNMEAVKLLLKHNAPHMPRSSDGELPMHFAEENGHAEVADFLKNYKPEITTKKESWYHGTLDRAEAQKILQKYSDELYKKLKSENVQVPIDSALENMYENQNKEVSERGNNESRQFIH